MVNLHMIAKHLAQQSANCVLEDSGADCFFHAHTDFHAFLGESACHVHLLMAYENAFHVWA